MSVNDRKDGQVDQNMAETSKKGTFVPPSEETPTEEIRRLNSEYRGGALRLQEIEGILRQKYEMDPPSVPKVAKLKTGLVTEEVIKKVTDFIQNTKNKEANVTQLNGVLGLCGITGMADTTSARTELQNRGVIKVEVNGNAKVITLVEDNG